VIVAIRLTTPLGFPAEVVTPDGLFLLVDPTSRTTPLGWLPPAHRGGRLLLCGQEHSVWVDVPDAAILRERVEYLLEGSVSAGGAMKGKLKILEYGDALNLRSTALLEGAKGLREHTLGLSPRALPKSWDVASKSRPTDLSAPFEVSIAFDSEDAFLLKGSEWSLNLPSFPRPPQTLPKPKGARRYPIEVSRGIESHWQANLIFESKRSITGSTAKLLTPLREAAWTATFRDGQLDLTLDHHKKSARWPANELDAALKVIKQDRSDYLLFLENALNFPANSVSTPGHN